MEGHGAKFGEKAEASAEQAGHCLGDIASVTADLVGRSGLGRDLDAEDLDSDVDADDKIVGDESKAAKNQAVVRLTGRWLEDEDSDGLKDDMISQPAVRSPMQRKRSPQHAWTGALDVPSAKLQFWRREQLLLRFLTGRRY
jgi:hypothetical protein